MIAIRYYGPSDRHDVANQQLVNVIMFNNLHFMTGVNRVISLEYYHAFDFILRVPQENVSWYSFLTFFTKSQVLLRADYMAILPTKIC